MGDPVVVESWHLPRALSDEALRLLTRLPMDEIERRLRGPAPAADGNLLPAKPPNIPSTMAMQYRSAWREGVEDGWNEARAFLARLSRPAVPPASLRQQALRPIPRSERLPGPDDCLPWPDEPDETPWCWAFVKGPLGDDSWERRPVSCLTAYKPMHTHWLPAHALPLPEFDHE